MSKQTKDLLERAAWTFVQTFLAVWAVSNFKFDKTVLIGCAAAGLSALKTFIKQTI
jgi:hypothetical protein